ncbi:MAG: helicase/exodeoxyribonuclease subunit [Bryobacterales bacterium]|nr:helicase/exodeoxyribonuclease subunit [Bryobacterales bacterium]
MPAFTPKQLEAIDIAQLGRDACIVAGPGSGKTTVLVERYRRLVTESGIAPHAILAITFTEKAASNMKTRLGQDAELKPLLENAWVSTVHGFCLRLVRENAIAAGVDPGVSILQEGQGALLQKKCLVEALDAMLAEQPEETSQMMRALASPQADLLGVYDAIRSAGVSLSELRDQPAPEWGMDAAELKAIVASVRDLPYKTPLQRQRLQMFLEWCERVGSCNENEALLELYSTFDIGLSGAGEGFKIAVKTVREHCQDSRCAAITAKYGRERSTLINILDRFEQLYARHKRERNVLDFSDLESYAVQLLQAQPEVRARTQEQFRQILMDEFQDTNGQQSKLLELLRAPDRFYAVGDINQSIFGFRHASPEVFRNYRDTVRDAGKHHVELLENWRSRPEILLATETILNEAAGIEHRKLVPGRKAAAKKQPSVEVIVALPPEGTDATALEARWVARRMREMHGTLRVEVKGAHRPADYRDMTVLVRNSVVYDDFAAAFEAEDIPYEQSRRKGFFETREAMDLAHLLRTIANPRDELSTAAVLRSPFVAVSDEALLRLKLISTNLADALDHLEEGSFDEQDREKLIAFRAQLRAWREAQPYVPVDRLLMRAIDQSGYPWDQRKASGAHIEKFLEMARASEGTLAEFLDEIELLRESDKAEAEAPVETDRDVVRMMTAHSAKGLEFPIVFIAALHKGVDTSRGNFSFTPKFGLGAAWINPATGEPADDSFHSANKEWTAEKEKEESNRLLYVALTRAEEHLVLSYSREENTKPAHWAKLIAPLFTSECVADGVARNVTVSAPSGESFQARVLCAATAPAMVQQGLGFEAPAEIPILAPPAMTGQHDSAVTVTSVAMFAKDPLQYYRERYIGWQTRQRRRLADIEEGEIEAEAKLPASELGSQVHDLLAGVELEGADATASRLAETFRRSELGRRAAGATRIEREFGFLIEIQGVVVRGQIDLWFEEAGELVLIDYKTDDVRREEAAERARDYAMQVHLYALVLERLTGRRVDSAFIHFLRCDEAVQVAPDTRAAESAVAYLARAQDSGVFGSAIAGSEARP